MQYRRNLFFVTPVAQSDGASQNTADLLSASWDPPASAAAGTAVPMAAGLIMASRTVGFHAIAPARAVPGPAGVAMLTASRSAAASALPAKPAGTRPAKHMAPFLATPGHAAATSSAAAGPQSPLVTLHAAATTQPSVVYIDPTAASGGNGTNAHPYNNWSFALQAGTTYLQKAGTVFTGVVHVTTAGTAAAPITIGAYGSGAAPAINGTVDFNGASYVTFSGFQLTNASGAAITIQQGSSHIDISGNVIGNARQGIWIGNNAGANITINNNVVEDSTGAGILIDSTLATAANPTIISNNQIYGNGADGILLTTNYAMIEDNVVAYNGLLSSATSGIHVYTGSASAGTGDDNTITGNVVAYNHDGSMQDGNGILLDQWTHNNTVSSNFALGNDGGGIVLYDSASNTITGNTTGENGVDSGKSHSIRAELILNEALGLTKNNVLTGNTFLAFLPTGFAAFVDTQTASAGNVLSGNIFENLAGPNVYQVAGIRGASLATWNSMLNAADHFSGVTVTAPTAGTTYAFTFPGGTNLPVGGHIDTLTGWSPSGGLFGT